MNPFKIFGTVARRVAQGSQRTFRRARQACCSMIPILTFSLIQHDGLSSVTRILGSDTPTASHNLLVLSKRCLPTTYICQRVP